MLIQNLTNTCTNTLTNTSFNHFLRFWNTLTETYWTVSWLSFHFVSMLQYAQLECIVFADSFHRINVCLCACTLLSRCFRLYLYVMSMNLKRKRCVDETSINGRFNIYQNIVFMYARAFVELKKLSKCEMRSTESMGQRNVKYENQITFVRSPIIWWWFALSLR